MVNYKRLVYETALLALLATAVVTAPAEGDKNYDQRQTGSENYRLNIDGIVVAVAPAESFLAAISEIDLGDLLGEIDYSDLKPPTKPSSWDHEFDKPSKPLDLPNLKPEVKPDNEAKPEETKPELQSKPTEASLSDVSLPPETKKQRKETLNKKEAGLRLKNRLAHLLLPLLRKTRHQ